MRFQYGDGTAAQVLVQGADAVHQGGGDAGGGRASRRAEENVELPTEVGARDPERADHVLDEAGEE